MALPSPDPPPLATLKRALVMTSAGISARFSTGPGEGEVGPVEILEDAGHRPRPHPPVTDSSNLVTRAGTNASQTIGCSLFGLSGFVRICPDLLSPACEMPT